MKLEGVETAGQLFLYFLLWVPITLPAFITTIIFTVLVSLWEKILLTCACILSSLSPLAVTSMIKLSACLTDFLTLLKIVESPALDSSVF